jgi:TolA-binding protein
MRRTIGLLALCLLLLIGCAYFNTFYNAKKQFKEAEKAYQANPPELEVSASQRELYEQAIKKASKILVFYPDSRYVDDALFLMGKAYFRMQEFGKSRRKFEELLVNYPKSKFRFEAGYLLGTIHYYMDEPRKARDALMAVIESKRNSWADDARYTLGEMAFWEGQYRQALEEYSRLPEDYPDSELRAEAMFKMGESQFKLEQYQGALDSYLEARRHKFSARQRYQIELRIGECYQQLGQFQDALETFNGLAGSDRYLEYLPEIQLRISEVYYLMGDSTRAIERYEDIVRQNEKTKEAAWAYYQLGQIFMEDLSDLEKAKDYFDKSKAEAPTSEAAQLASLRRSQINKLEDYRLKAASSDSMQLAEAYFSLGELYLLDLHRPDSALVYYQKVLAQNPDTRYAPRSKYAAAWITENSLGDSLAGRRLYEELIERYPYSESANTARRRLGRPAVRDTSDRQAAQRFRRAEELLLREGDAAGALAEYESIRTDFPMSPFVPKAECAVAWTLEHFLGQRDSALVIFQRLAEQYPNSECAQLAQKKIAPPAPPAAPDTSSSVEADSVSTGSGSEPPADEPQVRGEPELEEDDLEQEIGGDERRRPRRRPPDEDAGEE